MNPRRAQFFCCGFANGAYLQFVQFADIAGAILQAAQKIFHSIHAGEDYPVITKQVIDGLVERGVALWFDDLYCGAGNDARAEEFQLERKVLSLRQSARDYDAAAVERLLLNLICFS